jgi:hypothetical protein
MPLAILRTTPEWVESSLDSIRPRIRQIIARGLTCDEISLTANEVELVVQDGRRSSQGISLIVIANECPSRLKNLDARRTQIVRDLVQQLPGDMHGSVWILLAPGSYENF